MSKTKKKLVTTITLMMFFACVVLTGYFMLATNTIRVNSGSDTSTEVKKLLLKDISNNYPGTPHEVLKLYSRIIKCFYKEDLKKEQMEELADQIRLLFDSELLAQNPKDKYVNGLNTEIADYKKLEKTIANYTIQNSSSTIYSTVDEEEYASLVAEFMVKEKGKYEKSYEKFILRRDENGKWKILGWKAVQANEVDTE